MTDRQGGSVENSPSGQMGFVGFLTIVFVLLKAFDKIDWSWWWVFSPLWISFLLQLVVLIIVFLVVMVKRD